MGFFRMSVVPEVVPDSFTNGLLIPIPKKSGCDTSVPKNWWPIIISTTFSTNVHTEREFWSHI